MLKFNINNFIYVQITQAGEKFIETAPNNAFLKLALNNKIIIGDEEWCKIQCWELFSIFPINAWSNPLFETTIMFDENDLNEVRNA